MFRGTIKQFATTQQIEYVIAAGLVRYLKDRGIAKKVGTEKTKGAPKASDVYEIPCEIRISLSAVV